PRRRDRLAQLLRARPGASARGLGTFARAESLTVRHVGRKRPALRELDLEWREGERLLLLGPSGAGKSTLALCLDGVIPHSLEAHWESGRVTVEGRDTRTSGLSELARTVGVLFQDPETQLVMLETDDEIAFGLENLGVPREEMHGRVAAARAATGLGAGPPRPPSCARPRRSSGSASGLRSSPGSRCFWARTSCLATSPAPRGSSWSAGLAIRPSHRQGPAWDPSLSPPAMSRTAIASPIATRSPASRSTSAPARSWRSSGRTARGKAPSGSCSRARSRRQEARSPWVDGPSGGSIPLASPTSSSTP